MIHKHNVTLLIKKGYKLSSDFKLLNKVVLPPGKNDRPFSDNFVIWDPMNLVGGSN